jgi:BASS family bile acid:Na+ symporter
MPMSRYLFSAVLISSILFGLLFPSVTLLWKDYLNPILALLMFFSVLRVEKKELVKANPKELLTLLIFVFIIMPLLSLPFKLSDPMTFVGVLMAFAAPSAAATAFISSFLGGDIALGVAISFIASLLSLITLPLTTQLLVSKAVPVDQSKIFVILVEVIVIPTILALLSKKFLKGMSEVINENRDYQLIVLFLLGSAIVGIGHDLIVENKYRFIELTAFIILAILAGGALAYLFGRRYGKKAAVTFFVATGIRNAMLSFAIVLELFGASAVLPLVANGVAQFLVMALLEIFGSKL